MHNTYSLEMGVAHCVAPYATEKSLSYGGFLPKSRTYFGILLK